MECISRGFCCLVLCFKSWMIFMVCYRFRHNLFSFHNIFFPSHLAPSWSLSQPAPPWPLAPPWSQSPPVPPWSPTLPALPWRSPGLQLCWLECGGLLLCPGLCLRQVHCGCLQHQKYGVLIFSVLCVLPSPHSPIMHNKNHCVPSMLHEKLLWKCNSGVSDKYPVVS